MFYTSSCGSTRSLFVVTEVPGDLFPEQMKEYERKTKWETVKLQGNWYMP